MNRKRSITTVLAVVAIVGLGSLTVTNTGLPFAAESPPQKNAGE